jgi:hypothetical protein
LHLELTLISRTTREIPFFICWHPLRSSSGLWSCFFPVALIWPWSTTRARLPGSALLSAAYSLSKSCESLSNSPFQIGEKFLWKNRLWSFTLFLSWFVALLSITPWLDCPYLEYSSLI